MRTFSLPTFNHLSEPDSMPFRDRAPHTPVSLPDASFVISRDKNGNILSRLTDMSWKLYPYATQARGYATLNFSQKIKDLNSYLLDQHMLLLLITMHPPQGFTQTVSVDTILKRHSLLDKASHFAVIHDISLYDIFTSMEWFKLFASTISKALKEVLISFGRYLYKIERNTLPFPALMPPKSGFRKSKSRYSQTPVIPQRIYSYILIELERRIREFEVHWPSIKDFVYRVRTSANYATSQDNSPSMYVNRSNFENAIYPYGLFEYFSANEIKSTNQINRFLSKIQYTCKLLIHAYSGMRDDEAYSLPIYPITKERIDGKNITWIVGTTTKLEKGKKLTQWIIGTPGVYACQVAANIAKFFYEFNITSTQRQTQMLFPNVSALPSENSSNVELQDMALADLKHIKFSTFFRSEQTTLTEEDLKNLYLTEIGRDWANEKDFIVGKHWHFTSHQFRRSLAYYAIDGGLVQLTSLKRQMQHLSLLMTVYYAKGFTQYGSFFGDSSDHFRYEYNECRPTVQALTYFRDAFQSTVTLTGGHGTWIEQFMKSQGPVKIANMKEETLASFERGEIFYVSRPTGGCTNPSCNLWTIDPIAACSFKGCSKSVINSVKMRKAVLAYEHFALSLPKDSPERKTAEKIVVQAEEYLAKPPK
ncbi:hypothetical protein [Pseudomonas sp. NA-150]|uniref:hypothetical protein n=1 Tax=Pseudomonas sp. NA-150 TaxID=3367525 RepID=UPI0037C91BDF